MYYNTYFYSIYVNLIYVMNCLKFGLNNLLDKNEIKK